MTEASLHALHDGDMSSDLHPYGTFAALPAAWRAVEALQQDSLFSDPFALALAGPQAFQQALRNAQVSPHHLGGHSTQQQWSASQR